MKLCNYIQAQLLEHQYGLVDDGPRRELEEHLTECADCRRALDRARQEQALLAAARGLIFTKGVNAHDYKFSSAALEDFYHATPACRNRYLATAMFKLRGSDHADNNLITRAKAALAKS